MSNAESGITNIKNNVDTLITIPNDRLLSIAEKKTSMVDAFKMADDILRQESKEFQILLQCPVDKFRFCRCKDYNDGNGSCTYGYRKR